MWQLNDEEVSVYLSSSMKINEYNLSFAINMI